MATNDELLNRLQSLNEGNAPVESALVVHRTRTIEVTVGDIVNAIKARPDHPVAKAWLNNARLPANSKLVVDRADLEALLTGKEVEVTTTTEDGATVCEKCCCDEKHPHSAPGRRKEQNEPAPKA